MGLPDVSVILCTHNPRADYLDRVLLALRKQTLPLEHWELLLIDNASDESVAGRFDIGWQPNGRFIREEKLGLTPARLRGVAESVAEMIIFVDDDNVLDPDYLEQGLRIATAYPFLGTWGGQCVPEFEVEPIPDLTPYLFSLAIRTTERNLWTNVAGQWCEAYPFGAGLFVRRRVIDQARARTIACGLRQKLDRTGDLLLSGGDHEINLTACDMGLGCGVFQPLKLTHLIPSRRLTAGYMLRLWYGHHYSNALLFSARGATPADPLPTKFKRFFWKARLRRYPYPNRAFVWAQMLGIHDGLQFCRHARASSSVSQTLGDR
jgi:glycosyltransferase involved in cell wall biosynthesis